MSDPIKSMCYLPTGTGLVLSRLNAFVFLLLLLTPTLFMESGIAHAVTDDEFVFRVRGQDFSSKNALVTKVRESWNAQKPAIEAQWKAAGSYTTPLIRWTVFGVVIFSYSIKHSVKSVSLPDLPTATIGLHTSPNTWAFEVKIPVDWKLNVRASLGTLNADADLATEITLAGDIRLETNGHYTLSLKNLRVDANTSTNNSIDYSILGIPFTWRAADYLVELGLDAIMEPKIRTALLSHDANHNNVPDLDESFDLASQLPSDALPSGPLIYPIYTHLTAQNKITYRLTIEDDTPIVELTFGSPITGAWHPEWAAHPRLLYSATERASIVQKKSDGLVDWYTNIHTKAGETPQFATQNAEGIVDEAVGWPMEINNAHIALSATLVYDLEGPSAKAFRNNALKVLFNFHDQIGDGLFTETWGHKSLHTAEILTTLSQAYDLLLGTNFPNNISADEILANEFALPFWDWWRASLFISIGNTQSARDLLKTRIDGKLKRLRDLTYLHTHIWDLAESPNISMRNAGALGISALLFNQAPDADENISLAMSVIWKRLGISASQPINDFLTFSKEIEGSGYSEGPNYLNYAADLYLPFMWAYNNLLGTAPDQTFINNDWVRQNAIIIPNLITSERARKIHQWSLELSMPNGLRPNIKDGNYAAFYSGLLANAKASDADQRALWAWDFFRHGQLGRRLVDTFVAFDPALAAQSPETLFPSPSRLNAETGNLAFRNRWTEDAIYLHLLADRKWSVEQAIGGLRFPKHQQEDNTSFMLYAFGEPLALDSGYGSFAVRDLVNKAGNHNLILVDNLGPTPTSDAFVEETFDSEQLDFAEVTIAYGGADITRNVIFIDDRYFVLMDELRSTAPHQYDWLLHGNGIYSSAGERHLWTTANQRQLLLHLTNSSSDGASTVTADPDALHFNTWSNDPAQALKHTRIAAHEVSSANLNYLALLFPSVSSEALPVTASFSDGSSHTGIRVDFGDYADIFIARQPGHPAATRYDVPDLQPDIDNSDMTTDAELLFARVAHTGHILGLFGRNLSHVTYNNKNYLDQSTPAALTSTWYPDSDGDFVPDGEDAFPDDPSRWRQAITPMLELLLLRPTALAGDLDNNGCVDRSDLRIIQSYIRSHAATEPTPGYDLNGDGSVNIADARFLVTQFTNARGAPCQ